MVVAVIAALGCGDDGEQGDEARDDVRTPTGRDTRDARVLQPDAGVGKDAAVKDAGSGADRGLEDQVVRDLSEKDGIAVCESFVEHFDPSLHAIARVGCVFKTRGDDECAPDAISECLDAEIADLGELDCDDGLTAADRDCDITAGEVYDCLDAWAAAHEAWAAMFTCTGSIDELGPLFDEGPAKPKLCEQSEAKCPGLLEDLFD